MAKYKIIEPTEDKFTELARISFNHRYYSKVWKEHYGSENRAKMIRWEEKLDEWFKENLELLPEEEFNPEIPQTKERWGSDKLYKAK